MKRFDVKVLIILSLGHMVTDLYQGALPATLPFLKEKLFLSYAMTGFILMMANITSSVLQPVFGFYSDRKAKGVLLPIGVAASGIGFSLLTVPTTYVLVVLLVVISGLGVASFHPEGYKTAHYFTGERSVTGMSIFSVGGNVGVSLGPIIAIYIIQYLGLSALPIIVLPALVYAAIIVGLRKTLTIPASEHSEKVKGRSRTTAGAYMSLLVLVGVVIMRSWTHMGLLSYIPFYYISYLRGDPLFVGKLVFVFLVCGAAGTLLGAPLADRWGPKTFLRLSMFLATITLPLIFVPFIQKGILLFVVLGLQGGILVSTFAVTIVMAQRLLPDRLGVASGIMTGFAIGTGGLGVTLLGFVADKFGVPVALQSIMVLPFIGFLLSLVVRYKE
jgi:MFS transporter, FSR family, fosmidomycin resistance protein